MAQHVYVMLLLNFDIYNKKENMQLHKHVYVHKKLIEHRKKNICMSPPVI